MRLNGIDLTLFTEVANGIDRPIGATARSSGRIRFTPSEGAELSSRSRV